MNFNNTLFRASSIGHLMTEPKSKADKEAGNLSESAKTHIIDVYVSAKYGRKTDITNKYTNKGLMVEEDSITLYSRVKKQFFKKNESHLENDFIKGTPDLFTGKDIHHAERIIDVKSSWDIFTFFRTLSKDMNSLYYWQLQAYMGLTGATNATLAYCLVNTPFTLINDEKRKLLWKMGVVSEEDETYKEACELLEKQMVYDDIPLTERMIEYPIYRNDDDIERMYSKVNKARECLNQIESNNAVMVDSYEKDLTAIIISNN